MLFRSRLEKKIRKNKFDFDDFMAQIQQIKKMGNIKDLASMIPGVGKAIKDVDIDDNAFKDIYELTSVRFPETLLSIGQAAFLGCIGLRDTLIIPYGLRSIGSMAFNDCSGLTTLIWKARNCQGSQHDTTLRYSYFYRCMGLSDIIIDTGVEQLPVEFICNVSGVKRLEFKSATRSAIINLAARNPQMRQLVLPPQMKEICHGAF